MSTIRTKVAWNSVMLYGILLWLIQPFDSWWNWVIVALAILALVDAVVSVKMKD